MNRTNPLAVLAAALLTSSPGPALAASSPCQLLSRAEVQAAYKTTLSEGKAMTGSGGQTRCEYSTSTGGLIVTVMDWSALQGKSLKEMLQEMQGTNGNLPVHAVTGLGDEAVSAYASGEAVEGQPQSLTGAGSVMARKGKNVLMLVSILVGEVGPGEDALVKLARRALLRLP